MSESKGLIFAKSAKKHAGRAKEKLLQNLGKVDRTADEIFDEHLTNFSKQQNNANRLQKEFNNYIRCVRAVQTASKALMDAISEVYEEDWTGADNLIAQASAIEVLWQDFSHKLGDQVLIPLNTYAAQFPEMKKKIDKRGRKLVDYDSQRHSFQSLQANAAKRKDDVKLTKGREQLEEAKRTYEILNTELHDELPALHDSRILFLVTNLQTLFASEQMFHNETSKIYAELEAIVDKLATESQRGSYTMKKISANSNSTPSSPPQSPVKPQSILNTSVVNNNSYTNALSNGSSIANSPSSSSSSPIPQQPDQEMHSLNANLTTTTISTKEIEPSYENTTAIMSANHKSNETIENSTDSFRKMTAATVSTTSDPTHTQNNPAANEIANKNDSNMADVVGKENGNVTNRSSINNNNNLNNNKMEELYDIPVGATTTDLPQGVLYRVKATYKYTREDADELSFDVGDVINVTEYEDPEEQEEGWLMGTKDGTDEKGMFPANFTRPI